MNAIAIKNQLNVPIRNGLVSSLIGTFEKLYIFAIAFPRLACAKSANKASKNRDLKNVPVRIPCYVADPNAKILEGRDGNHGLPDFSHTPNRIYIKLNRDKSFRELRQYDEFGFPVLEIGYHSEKKYDKNLQNPVLHYHFFDNNLNRIDVGILTKDNPIYKKYQKYLKEFGL